VEVATSAPRIGVTIGTIGATAEWWLESARRLDEAGYPAIWGWDHFIGKGDRTVPVVEITAVLSAAAVVTRRAFIGPFVLNVMNRHPAVLARTASTLQAISGGRLRLGIGIGGHEREHIAYGKPLPEPLERAARLEEAIAVLRGLWAGGPSTFDGRYYSLNDAYAQPAPKPPPPILVGAHTPAGVRIAARAADGWAAEVPTYEVLRARYEDALAAAGRDRASQLVVVGFGEGRSGEDLLRGSPWVEAPRETWEEWRAKGADEVAVTARTTADIDALVSAVGRW
jgi:alkanesulfonate monooxygenase SsuD/methylene tetrahydromethanopterin reductase-like flavin-dependent oxidoreductase (luciferase family)